MKRILLDIETDTKHNHIWVVVTKDIDTGETKTWKQAKPLVEYLKDTTLIVAHNGINFDFPVLNRLWNTKIHGNQVFDTLIVSRLLDPSLENGHSLEAWGERLGVQKIDYRAVWLWMTNRSEKDTPKLLEFDEPHEALMDHYCVRDVDVLEVLYHHLVKLLNEKEFSTQSVELEHKVAAIISKQERNGFRLDQVYATNLLVDIQGKLDGIYEQMQQRWPPVTLERYSEKTGKRLKDTVVTFNPGSRQQIAEKLMEIGWKPKKHTDKGQVIVDEAVLSELKYPEAKLIADYLLLQKRISQIKSWFDCVGSDGRVHGRVITNGAVTGRMTHSSPNMAQIPNSGSLYGPECRECWTVDDGYVLVGADASGLELRMLAHYMKDDDYVKTVVEGSSKDGTDVHTKNQKAAGLQTRDQAKTFIYGFLYGAGPAKIGAIVGGSAKDGQRLIDSFLKATPSLQRLRDTVAKYASKGFVPGLDGRKIWVRSEHSALNSLLQGAGAIVMKQALVILEKDIRVNKLRAKFVANVHDEWQMECHPDDAEAVGKLAVASIRAAGEHFNLRCPLDGEYKIGKSWRQTH
jgi:DNA polymerase I-like protein with 3'-5' exonuclease and polymerase domains